VCLTVEAANGWLTASISEHNARFVVAPEQVGTMFVADRDSVDREILWVQERPGPPRQTVAAHEPCWSFSPARREQPAMFRLRAIPSAHLRFDNARPRASSDGCVPNCLRLRAKSIIYLLPNFARACGRVSIGGHPDKRPDSRLRK
jgi:hypothetical protein